MTILLTIATAAALGWAIDRFVFNGEFAGMLREEATLLFARRRRPAAAPRAARRGFGLR